LVLDTPIHLHHVAFPSISRRFRSKIEQASTIRTASNITDTSIDSINIIHNTNTLTMKSLRSSRVLSSLTLVILTTITLLSAVPSCSAASANKIDTRRYANVCVQSGKRYPKIQDKDSRAHAILKLAMELSTITSIVSYDTPQHKAICFLIFDDPKKVDPRGTGLMGGGKGRFTDRFALVTFYINTKGPGWQRSDHWMSKEDECLWYGVICTSNILGAKRVTELDLSFNKITGIIPREMAYLSELQTLDLNGNSLQGVIPYLMLSSLKKLTKLHLHMNDLFGNIPKEIGDLGNLKELTLFGNFFFGKIPSEISNLKKLEVLDIYANNLTGTIVSEIGKMKKLREVYVNDNEFVGSIPKEICKLKISHLQADCLGPKPEMHCECCTVCCKGLPTPTCKDVRPGAAKAAAKAKK